MAKSTSNIIKQTNWGKDTSQIQIKKLPKPSRLWPPPAYLGDHGIRFYKRVGRFLLDADILTELSRATFEHAALLYDRIHKMSERLAKDGEIIEDGRNSLKRHPAIMIQQAALNEFRSLCSELGLTPFAMNKLGVNLEIKKDETKIFLFGDE